MTLVIDTAPIVALADEHDPRRDAVRRLLRNSPDRLVVPAPITAEIDYFLSNRISPTSAERFLEDIGDGTFQVECLSQAEYRIVLFLSRRYAALNPGLADLSVVVLANRFRTNRILTFDERHFRAMEPLQGGSFTILPADSELE